MTPTGESTFVAAATLHIQALSNDMVVSCFTSNSISTAGTKINSYVCANTIVALSWRLVAHPSFVRGFVFDIGIIPALVIILMLCPDAGLKRDTVGLLRAMMPRREGVWDSRVVAEAGERMLHEDGDGDPVGLGVDVDVADECIDPRLRSESLKGGGGFEPTLRQFLGAFSRG